ncbi:MAG: MazG nucleotide pyrophosphohydrolase domain-containing protein [Patescibacteria group bacterium]|jgi:NTP pyrophosphatase (non-canonical NTP hydrolase)
MNTEEIQKLIREEHEKTLSEIGAIYDQDRRTLNRTVKLMEEVGELSNEIMSSMNMQRSEKMSDYKKDNISSEIADVIITALLIAENIDIDAFESVKKKMGKIKARRKKLQK